MAQGEESLSAAGPAALASGFEISSSVLISEIGVCPSFPSGSASLVKVRSAFAEVDFPGWVCAGDDGWGILGDVGPLGVIKVTSWPLTGK